MGSLFANGCGTNASGGLDGGDVGDVDGGGVGNADAGNADAGNAGNADAGNAGNADAGNADAGSADAGAPSGFNGYVLPPDPDPSLPVDGQLDILVLGTPGVGVTTIASILQSALLALPEYSSVRVDSYVTSWNGLMGFYFGWTDRTTRLAVLDGGYDYIVFSDVLHASILAPEGHVAAVLELADAARALGATPVLMMVEVGSPLPGLSGEMCSNTCPYSTTSCNDGGSGADGVPYCDLGTDCDDCGVRTSSDRERMATEEHFWRTAIGTGSIPVPSGAVLGKLEVGWGDRPTMLAATLYTAFTNESITSWSGWATTGDWPTWADEVLAHHTADQTAVHYTMPHLGNVRVEPIDPGATYRYLTSGTSSEAGYATAMQALLIREGYAPSHTSVGFCQANKAVNTECMERVADEMQNADYISLYARGYAVSRADIHTAGGSTILQPQVYDRHWDGAMNDGSDSLDNIYARSRGTAANSRYYDLAWLPQHINFGKYKVATGSDLLSDGVHATSSVQAGLAAMSYVSRTGRSPTTVGVSADAAKAIELGEHTVRTLSTYSRTGLYIPDLAQNRVSPH